MTTTSGLLQTAILFFLLLSLNAKAQVGHTAQMGHTITGKAAANNNGWSTMQLKGDRYSAECHFTAVSGNILGNNTFSQMSISGEIYTENPFKRHSFLLDVLNAKVGTYTCPSPDVNFNLTYSLHRNDTLYNLDFDTQSDEKKESTGTVTIAEMKQKGRGIIHVKGSFSLSMPSLSVLGVNNFPGTYSVRGDFETDVADSRFTPGSAAPSFSSPVNIKAVLGSKN